MTREEMVTVCQRRDQLGTGRFYLAVKRLKNRSSGLSYPRCLLEKKHGIYDTLEAVWQTATAHKR